MKLFRQSLTDTLGVGSGVEGRKVVPVGNIPLDVVGDGAVQGGRGADLRAVLDGDGVEAVLGSVHEAEVVVRPALGWGGSYLWRWLMSR